MTEDYSVENLVDTFKKHDLLYKKKHEEMLNEYKQNFPDESIPDHFKETFSLCLALESICKEIVNLKGRIK